MSPPRRVVLLARPGPACERLAEAAREAGAEIALVADPTEADPDAVRAARPEALLVALEPAVETAIERFQDLYTDPDMRSVPHPRIIPVSRASAACWPCAAASAPHPNPCARR